jgi:hypothetical protein
MIREKKLGFSTLTMLMVLVLYSSISPAFGQAADEAPAKLQAALIMKLLAFYNNLGSQPFTIHVVGAPDVAKQLKGQIGKTAGKATLNAVTEGDAAPSDACHVIYVGQSIKELIAFSQANSVLSVTGRPELVPQGVTLGIGIENKKPKILLNLSSSKAENINWNPAILKVAATFN